MAECTTIGEAKSLSTADQWVIRRFIVNDADDGTIREPGANAGENPAANLNDLVESSSNFEDIPANLKMFT